MKHKGVKKNIAITLFQPPVHTGQSILLNETKKTYNDI